jgi:hypothetical protein
MYKELFMTMPRLKRIPWDVWFVTFLAFLMIPLFSIAAALLTSWLDMSLMVFKVAITVVLSLGYFNIVWFTRTRAYLRIHETLIQAVPSEGRRGEPSLFPCSLTLLGSLDVLKLPLGVVWGYIGGATASSWVCYDSLSYLMVEGFRIADHLGLLAITAVGVPSLAVMLLTWYSSLKFAWERGREQFPVLNELMAVK